MPGFDWLAVERDLTYDAGIVFEFDSVWYQDGPARAVYPLNGYEGHFIVVDEEAVAVGFDHTWPLDNTGRLAVTTTDPETAILANTEARWGYRLEVWGGDRPLARVIQGRMLPNGSD